MFHDVDFDHGEGCTGEEGHGVDGEIEGGVSGDEGADLECVVAQERGGWDTGFAAGEEFGRGGAWERKIGLFDDGGTGGCEGSDRGKFGGRQVGVASGRDFGTSDLEGAFENVDEALVFRWAECAARGEFGCVLGEAGPGGWRDVDDGGGPDHTGKGCADEGIGSLQEVVDAVGATSSAEMGHRKSG